jgi:predicted amidohydrolase YtcJ
MRQLANILLLSLFLTGQAWAQTSQGMTIFADAIFYNGKVVTVDERFSVAQAFAVREGKIMAVGSNREILDLAGAKSRRLDLKGKTVLPGFIDTHAHLFIYAVENWPSDLESLEPQLKEFRQRELRVGSVEEASASLKKTAAQSQ